MRWKIVGTQPGGQAPVNLTVEVRARVDEPTELLASLPDAGERLPQSLTELWPKIESMSFDQFRSEVTPYLPLHVAQAIDEAAFDDMRLDVGTRVEQWLRAATGKTPASESRTAPDSSHAPETLSKPRASIRSPRRN